MSKETQGYKLTPGVLRKKVGSTPMNLGDYNVHRGREIPADEDPAQEGYLVVDQNGGRETWMPKETFERDCLAIHDPISFKQASQPLMNWLSNPKNAHPHMCVQVTSENAELLEGLMMATKENNQ